MRVGLISDTWFPSPNGVVSVVATLRQGLITCGHEVRLVTISPRKPDMGGSKFNRMSGSSEWYGQVSDLDTGDLPISGLPMWSSVGGRSGWKSPSVLARYFQEHRLDLIHTHTEFGLGWAARQAAQQAQIPHIHTLHTAWDQYLHFLPGRSQWWRSSMRTVIGSFLKRPTLLTVPSTKAVDWLESQHFRSADATISNPVHPSFVSVSETDQTQARQRLGIPLDRRVVLVVGRVSPEKRTRELIDSLSGLLATCPQLCLVFLGPKKRSYWLPTYSAQVRFVGPVHWDKMPDWYTAADVMVSVSQSEFQPVSVLEALHTGLPVIARFDSAYAEITEAFPDGLTLIDTDDQLPELLMLVLTSPPQFSADPGQFRIELVAKRWEDLYNQVVSNRFSSQPVGYGQFQFRSE